MKIEPGYVNNASHKIESIRSVFQETQLLYERHVGLDVLLSELENNEPEYRSVSYESLSFAIALKELENFSVNQQNFPGTDQPGGWYYFAEGPALMHKAQVYIGLGWAIAKLELPFLDITCHLEPGLRYRIADGCGYYDGIFRQRLTVLGQHLPAYLPETALPVYYQGVGRSLWYSCKADIHKVHTRITGFPAARQADLWRGIGSAVAYVGGSEEDVMHSLMGYAGIHAVHLAAGAALAVKSRMEANTMTGDTDKCCRYWFKKIIDKIPGSPAAATLFSPQDDIAYYSWIVRAESQVANYLL